MTDPDDSKPVTPDPRPDRSNGRKPDSVAGEEDPGAAVDAPVKDGHRPGDGAEPSPASP